MTVEVKSTDPQMSETSPNVVVEEAEKGVVEVEKKNEGVVVESVGEKKIENVDVDEEKGGVEELGVILKSGSFKEESSLSSDLKEYEKKALNELKSKVEEAILQNKIFKKKDVEQKKKPKEEEIEKPAEQGGEVEEKEKDVEEVKNPIEGTTEEKAAEEEKEKPVEEVEKPIEATEEKVVEEDKEKPAESGAEEKAVEVVEEVKNTIEETEEKAVEEKEKLVEEVETPIEEEEVVDKDISIWGVPLLPSNGAVETDVVLLKFLRARDFRVNEALDMLINTLKWRKAYKSDSILEEEFSPSLNSVAFMDGVDREGHPICFNVYGTFQDNELYQKTFGTEEQRQQFLRWRIQLMEKGIHKLEFSPKGVNSLLQINDLKNTPGLSKKELRVATKQAVGLLQDNYPEFVARNIFINVPFWYYAFNALLSPFLTQRTKSKFVFARPANVTDTLLKYIPANEIPIKYGGLKRGNDSEFSVEEVTELVVKAGLTETIEIPAPEVGTTLLWDLIVVGGDVTYKEEFVPSDEGSYTIIVQKAKKLGYNEEPARNSFRNNEPGKMVLTIENGSFKKKRVLYRHKVKESST